MADGSKGQGSSTQILVALIAMVGTVTAAYLSHSRNALERTSQANTQFKEPDQLKANRPSDNTPSEVESRSKDRSGTPSRSEFPWTGVWVSNREDAEVHFRETMTFEIDATASETYRPIYNATVTQEQYDNEQLVCELSRKLEIRPEPDAHELAYEVMSHQIMHESFDGACSLALADVAPTGKLSPTGLTSFSGFPFKYKPDRIRMFYKKGP